MKKDDDLKQIKELLEIVAHKVDVMEVSRTGQSASFHLMKDQQSVMNSKLDEIRKNLEEVKETLQGHTGSLMNIERLDERLTTVEDQLEIQPSDQLAIQR